MTREEAVEKWIMPACKKVWNEKRCNEILKALEQDDAMYYPQVDGVTPTVVELVDESNGSVDERVDERVDDCISRQAVLKAIDVKAWEFCDYLIRNGRNDEQKPVSHFADNLRECISEDLSPVTPAEKAGRWIEKDGYDGDTYYDCSECGESWTTIEGTPWNNGMKYCPNCGAKMQEVQDADSD